MAQPYRSQEEARAARLELLWARREELEIAMAASAELAREHREVSQEIASLRPPVASRSKARVALGCGGVIAGGALCIIAFSWVAHAAMYRQVHERMAAARTADTVREASVLYRLSSDQPTCPTVGRLVRDKQLLSARSEDPWGNRYEIACFGDEPDDVQVRSAGKDQRLFTADDIVSPLQRPGR